MKNFFNKFLLLIYFFILFSILIFCLIYLIVAFITWEISPINIDWFIVRIYVVIAIWFSVLLSFDN